MNISAPIFSLLAFCVILSPAAAEVKTITYCDTLSGLGGSWEDNYTVPLFDPEMGKLMNVSLAIDLDVQLDFNVENQGPEGTVVASDSDLELAVTLPDSSSITATASSSVSEVLGEFDGETDFSGPSGAIVSANSTGSGEEEYLDTSDFIATSPNETISLPAALDVRSRTQMPGNCLFGVSTLTRSDLCVTYVYDPEADGGE